MNKKTGILVICILAIVVVSVILYVNLTSGECVEWNYEITKEYAYDQCYKENYTNCEITYEGDDMYIDFNTSRFETNRTAEHYTCTKWEGIMTDYEWAELIGNPHAKGEFCETAEDKDDCCKNLDENGAWDDRWNGCVIKTTTPDCVVQVFEKFGIDKNATELEDLTELLVLTVEKDSEAFETKLKTVSGNVADAYLFNLECVLNG